LWPDCRTIAAMAANAPSSKPLMWDIFCKVIDNFGDLGVCWRLSADLATRGHRVRLWVDDASALAWMAPGAIEGRHTGVQVLPWSQSQDPAAMVNLPSADVWIEAFGCDIAPEFIAYYACLTGTGGQNDAKHPVWINLEYLSAESFVERVHGLPSPVLHGPAKGWTKYFFYPGFTQRTGGLLREPGLVERRAAFDRAGWLASQGIAWHGERLVSLFCYEPLSLSALLDQLAAQPQPTRLLVTSGRTRAAVQAVIEHKNRLQPSWNKREALSFSYLPWLDQLDFDHLLWSCDLNFVRGEDSLARAIWAGAPFVWQIYGQDDGAHATKLEAFLDLLGADTELRNFFRAWNGLPEFRSGTDNPGPALPWQDPRRWQALVTSFRDRLMTQDDLVAALIQFVNKKR
jgi:uncharacterized repeat protein (TIGR03837 family)